MNLELGQDGLCMKPKQLLKVRKGSRHTIVCQSGSLWVTQYGDRRDILLAAGESFVLDRDGPALVQALQQTTLSIVAPAARTAPTLRPWAQAYAAGQVRGALGVQA